MMIESQKRKKSKKTRKHTCIKTAADFHQPHTPQNEEEIWKQQGFSNEM